MQADIVRIKPAPQKWRSISSNGIFDFSITYPGAFCRVECSASASSRIATTAPMAAKEDIALRTGDTFSRSSKVGSGSGSVNRSSLAPWDCHLPPAATMTRVGQVGFVSSDFGGVVSDEQDPP